MTFARLQNLGTRMPWPICSAKHHDRRLPIATVRCLRWKQRIRPAFRRLVGCCLFFLFAVVLPAAVAGCSQDQPDNRLRDLQTLQAQNGRLNTENDSLRNRNHQLRDQLEQLRAGYENLKVQKEELQRWNRGLIKACGPSVWDVGMDEYPLPYKFYRKASLKQLVNELNHRMRTRKLPSIELEGVEGATAHVRIPQETLLTQQMGTTGAEAYLNAVAYTLCSLEEITCVDFEFHAGDHAMPGLLCPQ